MIAATTDQILDELNAARQRATYGAVAAVVGASARALMSGRQRNQRHSWIVNQRSGQPTEYADEQLHPVLSTNPLVIETCDELAAWLSSRGVQLHTDRAA